MTGVDATFVVPLPNCPELFAPQHSTVPPTISAHVWALPAATVSAPARPVTVTGSTEFVVVPFPNCPEPLLPQHFAIPLATTAQVCAVPAAIATAPARPFTSIASAPFVVVPSPSWPVLFSPQHFIVPAPGRAQACAAPPASNGRTSREPASVLTAATGTARTTRTDITNSSATVRRRIPPPPLRNPPEGQAPRSALDPRRLRPLPRGVHPRGRNENEIGTQRAFNIADRLHDDLGAVAGTTAQTPACPNSSPIRRDKGESCWDRLAGSIIEYRSRR